MKLTEKAYRIWLQNPDLDYGFICKLCKMAEEAKKEEKINLQPVTCRYAWKL